MSASSPNKKARHPRLRWLRTWIEHVFAVLGVLFLAYHAGFDLSVMTSSSMAPTLCGNSREDGEWILSEKISYWFRGPRRWEVVTFQGTFGAQVMKRVVGLPGEKVSLKDGRVLIDREPVDCPPSVENISYLPYGKIHRGGSADCGDGYFVLGDNSVDALDSRFEGPLSIEKITGRAWLVVWPLSKFRFATP